jgi:hypothetical protein
MGALVGRDRSTFGFALRPSREFAPAGDLLFERPKRRQKVAPDRSPFASLRVPCDARSSSPRAKLPSLCSGQTVARSQSLKRAAHAGSMPCASRLRSKGGEGTPSLRRLVCWLFLGLPFGGAEKRRSPGRVRSTLQRLTSGPLFEQSVAARVGPGPGLRASQGTPQRSEGATEQGSFFAYFLSTQKVSRPPGRTPGMGLRRSLNTRNRHRPTRALRTSAHIQLAVGTQAADPQGSPR